MTSSALGNAGIKVGDHLPVATFKNKNNKKMRKNIISCGCNEKVEQTSGGLYRRQLLLASTSLRVRGGLISKAEDIITEQHLPPADLTNYRKLANALDANSKGEENIGMPWVEYSDYFKAPQRNGNDFGGLVAPPPAALALHHNSSGAIEAVVKKWRKAKHQEEEVVVVIEGIEVQRDTPLWFDVYLSLPTDTRPLPSRGAYAGSFVYMPRRKPQLEKEIAKLGHDQGRKVIRKCCLSLAITDILDELHADAHHAGDDIIVVTLLPRAKSGDVRDSFKIKVATIKIE